MPKGLIPLLMLSPDSTSSFGSRSSLLLKSPTRASYSPPLSPAHRRNQSDLAPTIKLSRPPARASIVLKRQSQQLPTSLPHIPYTSAEWKRAIGEIKRYHVTRRFRACSAKCNEILTNIKNISVVEPAYLICLNFYAATSLEMCARPLAPASAYRISLLQQARTHYERAAILIRTAEDMVILRTRSSSAASSLSSLHSPSGSVSSRAWTPESGLVTPSICTFSRKSSLTASSNSICTSRPSKKKTVSFELPRDKSRWSLTIEPAIRPDSPTLGFDDEYFAAGAMRQELPELPTSAMITSKRFSPLGLATQQHLPTPHMPSIIEREETLASSPLESTCADSPSTDGTNGDEYPFFALSPQRVYTALTRYCETLTALKSQVASHTAALGEALAEDVQLNQTRPSSPVLHNASSAVVTGLQRMSLQHSGGARQSRRGSASNPSVQGLETSRRVFISASETDMNDDGDGEDKARERKARIDRLKLSGWRRKRFDASRYEDLCDMVISELNG